MSQFTRSIIVVTVLTVSLLLLCTYQGKAQQQGANSPFKEKERVIKKNTDFKPPVTIKSAKAKGHPIPFNSKFNDEDDWLNGFAVLVRNDSNKTVSHIGIEMLFRPIGGGQQIPAGWFLNYGPNPFYYKSIEAIPQSTVPSLLPENETDLKLSGAQFEEIKMFLKEAGFPDKVHFVEIRVNTIGFTDGTAWYGKMLKRDASSTTGWTVLGTASDSFHHAQLSLSNPRNSTGLFF